MTPHSAEPDTSTSTGPAEVTAHAESGASYAPFARLTAPHAALYRQVMRVFLTAKERFAVHLRPEDVHAALPSEHRPAAPDAVVKALDSLVGWGNLRADPDTSRVTAVEDFYRRRFIYQLTQAGEAAEQALSVYDEALGQPRWPGRGRHRPRRSRRPGRRRARAGGARLAGRVRPARRAHPHPQAPTGRLGRAAARGRPRTPARPHPAGGEEPSGRHSRGLAPAARRPGRLPVRFRRRHPQRRARPRRRHPARHPRPVRRPCPDRLPGGQRSRVAPRGLGLRRAPQGRPVLHRPHPRPARHPRPRPGGRRRRTRGSHPAPAHPYSALHGTQHCLRLREPGRPGHRCDTLGAACPPLVCLQGQPSAAALTLLRHLQAHGTTLRYHGDFDWGGLRIASALLRRVPWHPWRYRATDYRTAVPATPRASPLTGTPTTAAWDPDLPAALTEFGVRIEEETVLDDLLAELGQ